MDGQPSSPPSGGLRPALRRVPGPRTSPCSRTGSLALCGLGSFRPCLTIQFPDSAWKSQPFAQCAQQPSVTVPSRAQEVPQGPNPRGWIIRPREDSRDRWVVSFAPVLDLRFLGKVAPLVSCLLLPHRQIKPNKVEKSCH